MRRLLALVLLAGCGEPAPADTDPAPTSGCVAGGTPVVEVGKGERRFEAEDDDGGRSILIHGMQGGFHSFVSIRSRGLDTAGPWDLRIEGFLGDESLAQAVLSREPDCNAEVDRGESIGTWLVWWSTPEVLHGEEVTIAVEVEDATGTVVSATGQQVLWDQFQWDED